MTLPLLTPCTFCNLRQICPRPSLCSQTLHQFLDLTRNADLVKTDIDLIGLLSQSILVLVETMFAKPSMVRDF